MNFRRLSRNVITLGWVSLLMDMASEMLYPIIPIYLTQVLGASPELLGLIEGVAEGGGSILRWMSGALSDRFRRRKPFVVAGYSLAALSKPLMGAAGWPLFFAARVLDRVGKSIRTSPRDALIADSTDAANRGLAFGFHRAMDTCGAVLGPLVVVVLLWLHPKFPLRWLFIIALAPGLASAMVALLAVRDIPHEANPQARPPSLWQAYSGSYWILILANAIFTLGNSVDSFLILRSTNLGLNTHSVILAYILFNGVFATTALPFGSLSDRFGRKPIIIGGWLIFAGVYFGFAAARSSAVVWGLFAIYGLYQALTEGISKAMVTDLVAPHQRGGAIGLFYTITGICQIAANLITGALWSVSLTDYHLQAGLLTGTLGALVAIPIIAIVGTRPKPVTPGASNPSIPGGLGSGT